MASRSFVGAALGAFAVACGPALIGSDAVSTSGTSEEGGDDRPVTTTLTTAGTNVTSAGTSGANPTTVTDPTADGGETTDDGSTLDPSDVTCGAFILECWDSGAQIECDVWAQDCPEGEKCMPWANDGGPWWNATRCSPIDPNPTQIGDPCLVEGSSASGIDNCDLGLMCLWVDPETNTGSCVQMCQGSQADPQCSDPATTCVVAFDGVITDCLPTCDPLLQDCVAQAACVPADDAFVCAATGDDGVLAGFPCATPWDCAPGLFCAVADLVPGCVEESCCTAFCDLASQSHDCAPEQICAPFESPPEGLENVGRCTVP